MFKVGDKVKFKQEVLNRTEGHGRKMRGTVVDVAMRGKVIGVDTHGTWVSDDDRPVRYIPAANLEIGE